MLSPEVNEPTSWPFSLRCRDSGAVYEAVPRMTIEPQEFGIALTVTEAPSASAGVKRMERAMNVDVSFFIG